MQAYCTCSGLRVFAPHSLIVTRLGFPTSAPRLFQLLRTQHLTHPHTPVSQFQTSGYSPPCQLSDCGMWTACMSRKMRQGRLTQSCRVAIDLRSWREVWAATRWQDPQWGWGDEEDGCCRCWRSTCMATEAVAITVTRTKRRSWTVQLSSVSVD